MTISQKAALSLLITIILFGGFTALAFTGLFDLVEARFYNPSRAASITRDVAGSAETIDSYIEEIQARFLETLELPAVRRSFLPNQSAEDIFERSRVYGLFAESTGGVQWIRFIDSGGARLHFSTYAPDVLRQDSLTLAYRNYEETNLLYGTIAVSENSAAKILIDGEADRIIFSFPFYDSFDVYRGTAVLSLSIKAVSDILVREGRINIGQNIAAISNPPGFVSGIPGVAEKELVTEISAVWNEGILRAVRLDSRNSEKSFSLFSVRAPKGFFVGRIVDESLFGFPFAMKVILLSSFFLTVYLTVFLFFNFRQDPVTIVQNRIKQLQITLIEQFYERKSDMDWSRWSRELELRRDEINAQLKQGIKNVSAAKNEDIDILINKSWDELLSVMGTRRDAGIDKEKLRTILDRVLAAIPVERDDQPSAGIDMTEEIEELESVEELSELDEAEMVEDLIELDEAEPAEDLVELDEAEPVEELTELEEAEAVEELTELVEEFAEELEEIMPVSLSSGTSIANLASEIEFAPRDESDHAEEELIREDLELEIVSPFSTMLSNLSSPAGELEELAGEDDPLPPEGADSEEKKKP